MSVRGTEYTEDYEFEMFGEDVTAVLSPLPDQRFLPIAAFLQVHLGLEDKDEAIAESIDKVEEAKGEAEEIGEESLDISKMDTEFVVTLQRAAKFAIKGSYDPETGEFVEHTPEMNETMLEGMVGGYSVELGGKALEVSGDVRDATKFRGSRGGQRGFSDSE